MIKRCNLVICTLFFKFFMFAPVGDDGGVEICCPQVSSRWSFFASLKIFATLNNLSKLNCFRLSQKVTQRLFIICPLRGLLFVCEKIRIFSCKSFVFG